MKDIGKKIKVVRLEKKMLQSEVAEVAGISRSTYNMIEGGLKEDILLKTAIGISKALDIPFTELFEIETQNVKQETDKLKALVLQSLVKYVNDQIFLEQFEHNEQDPADWEKFQVYRDHLRKFQKGYIQMLVSVGFCTSEDVAEFYNWLHDRGKYKKEK